MFGSSKAEPSVKANENKLAEAAVEKILKTTIFRKMPKDYKSGNFSLADYQKSSVLKTVEPSKEEPMAKTDQAESAGKSKAPLIIIILIVVVALIVGAFYYFNLGAKISDLMFGAPVVEDTSIVINKPIIASTTIATTTDLTIASSTNATSTLNTDIFPGPSATSSATSTTSTTTETVATSSSVATIDSDADGLNDFEEKVLGTDPQKADTDGDTFNDLKELTGLYNPNGAGKIEADKNLVKYTNPTYKYNFYYPKALTIESGSVPTSMIFSAEDGSYFQVIVSDNTKKQAIADWYLSEFKQTVPASRLTTIAGLSAVKSIDGLVVYFTDSVKKNIYIISYTPATPDVLSLKEVFQLMIATFKF